MPSLWSEFAEPISRRDSTIHKEVAAGDKCAVSPHQECGNISNLVGSSGAISLFLMNRANLQNGRDGISAALHCPRWDYCRREIGVKCLIDRALAGHDAKGESKDSNTFLRKIGSDHRLVIPNNL
jgi:hypothetical protein